MAAAGVACRRTDTHSAECALPLCPSPPLPQLHRKAYRLGKFLQDVNGLRKVQLGGGHLALLELLVYLGEGTYYFLDQFTW